jgi:hypothetical protein
VFRTVHAFSFRATGSVWLFLPVVATTGTPSTNRLPRRDRSGAWSGLCPLCCPTGQTAGGAAHKSQIEVVLNPVSVTDRIQQSAAPSGAPAHGAIRAKVYDDPIQSGDRRRKAASITPKHPWLWR